MRSSTAGRNRIPVPTAAAVALLNGSQRQQPQSINTRISAGPGSASSSTTATTTRASVRKRKAEPSVSAAVNATAATNPALVKPSQLQAQSHDNTSTNKTMPSVAAHDQENRLPSASNSHSNSKKLVFAPLISPDTPRSLSHSTCFDRLDRDPFIFLFTE
jgi:hypothetical protein